MDWENWWALSDAQAISRKFDYTEELLKYYRVFWEKGIEVANAIACIEDK